MQQLQASLPELQTNLEDCMAGMIQQFEESQSRIEAEQNKNKVEIVRNQEEMRNSMRMVMAELKNISNKVGMGLEREEVSSRDPQLFVEGGGFEIPHGMLRRSTSQPPSKLTNWRTRCLEFPVFSGDDPDGWIARTERCHEFYHLMEVEKLEMAIIGLEGDALHYFH